MTDTATVDPAIVASLGEALDVALIARQQRDDANNALVDAYQFKRNAIYAEQNDHSQLLDTLQEVAHGSSEMASGPRPRTWT